MAEPTTGPIPSEPPATPVTGATDGAASPANDQLPSSRQVLQQAGVESAQVDWKAKYDGVVGASRSRIAELQKQVEAHVLEVTTLKDQLGRIQADATVLKTKADTAQALQTEVESLKGEKEQAVALNSKQALLFKYPQLLSVQAEGGANPLVELVMKSSMPLEDLEKAAEQLAQAMGLQAQARTASNGGTPPAAAPITGSEDLGTLRKKALEADDAYIKSGFSDSNALAESQRLWALIEQAQNKK